jgi:hypothetical protein
MMFARVLLAALLAIASAGAQQASGSETGARFDVHAAPVDADISGILTWKGRAVSGATPGDTEPAAVAADTGVRYRLLDIDGSPLPFIDDEQVLDFLSKAEVISITDVGRGSTKPKKLVLAKDGVRAHAIFRYSNIIGRTASKRGMPKSYVKDRYAYEVAAYELSRLLGLHRVPPVVMRKVNGVNGSVQIWLEDVIMNVDRRDRALKPPDPTRWEQQNQILQLFDNILGNRDRNLGNLLIDRSWTTWFIDHSRSFMASSTPLNPEVVTQCERRVWQSLQSLDQELVQERMKPYLDRFERKTLVARIDHMIEHINEQIANHSQESVLFDLTAAGPPVESWQ